MPESPQASAERIPIKRAELSDSYDACVIFLTSARPALLWRSNNRIRLFSPTKKPAPAQIFTLLRFWNCYEYFYDLSDLMPFFQVFFYDYIIHLCALPPTISTPAPAHSEHPSGTQPRHYLYMFTYPCPQRRPPTTPYSIGQEPTGSPLSQAKPCLDGFSLTGHWLSLKASNSLYG